MKERKTEEINGQANDDAVKSVAKPGDPPQVHSPIIFLVVALRFFLVIPVRIM